jgi:hypothetical protein
LNRIGLIEVPFQGTVQEDRFTQGVALGYDDAPFQGADIHNPTGMLCLERLVDRYEQTRKNGGIAIACRDAGAPRDALAIYEVGQDGHQTAKMLRRKE